MRRGRGLVRAQLDLRDPKKVADARLHYQRESRRQAHWQDRRRTGGVAGLEDVAIGDELQNWTLADLDAYILREMKKDTLRARFNIWPCITAAAFMGFVGIIVSRLKLIDVLRGSQEYDKEAASDIYWGIIYGVLFTSFCNTVYQVYQIKCNRNGRHKKHMAALREALRRREASILRRNDEFSYYDSAIEHGCCMRICCCSRYGRITSGRINYAPKMPWPKRSCTSAYIRRLCCGCCKHHTKMIAYNDLLDVGVKRSCCDMMLGTGTLVLHCAATSKPAQVKELRDNLIARMDEGDERKIREAILSCGGSVILRDILLRANRLADKLASQRKARAEAEGKEFEPIMVRLENLQHDTATTLLVHDVTDPHRVLDDISYRICKRAKLEDVRDRIIRAAGIDTSVVGDGDELPPEDP